MNINYALAVAIAAPIIDGLYDLSKRRYWSSRILAYNNIQWDEDTIAHFVDRATIIDSHFRFFGWWTMSLIGTFVTAYDSKELLFCLILALAVLIPMWIYFLTLKFDEIVGWRKSIPKIYRILGYGVSIVVAIAFPK